MKDMHFGLDGIHSKNDSSWKWGLGWKYPCDITKYRCGESTNLNC